MIDVCCSRECTRVRVSVDHLVQPSLAPLRAAVCEHFAPGDRIVVDLSRVTFMDSSALGVLINGLKRVGPDGGIEVIAPHPSVRALFRMTRMDRVFTLVDVASAVEWGKAA